MNIHFLLQSIETLDQFSSIITINHCHYQFTITTVTIIIFNQPHIQATANNLNSITIHRNTLDNVVMSR